LSSSSQHLITMKLIFSFSSESLHSFVITSTTDCSCSSHCRSLLCLW
jgi:hypothetical protein